MASGPRRHLASPLGSGQSPRPSEAPEAWQPMPGGDPGLLLSGRASPGHCEGEPSLSRLSWESPWEICPSVSDSPHSHTRVHADGSVMAVPTEGSCDLNYGFHGWACTPGEGAVTLSPLEVGADPEANARSHERGVLDARPGAEGGESPSATLDSESCLGLHSPAPKECGLGFILLRELCVWGNLFPEHRTSAHRGPDWH